VDLSTLQPFFSLKKQNGKIWNISSLILFRPLDRGYLRNGEFFGPKIKSHIYSSVKIYGHLGI
jgi:hypothetical protein